MIYFAYLFLLFVVLLANRPVPISKIKRYRGAALGFNVLNGNIFMFTHAGFLKTAKIGLRKLTILNLKGAHFNCFM